MSASVIYTETRPSTLIDFVNISPEDKKYLEDNYGMYWLTQSEQLSDDQLVRTFTTVWTDIGEFYNHLNDPVCVAMGSKKESGNKKLGIIRTFEIKTT